MDGATMNFVELDEKTRTLISVGLSGGDAKFGETIYNSDDPSHEQTLSVILNEMLMGHTEIAENLNDFAKSYETYQLTPASETSEYLAYENEMQGQYQEILESVYVAIDEMTEEKTFAHYVAEIKPADKLAVTQDKPLNVEIIEAASEPLVLDPETPKAKPIVLGVDETPHVLPSFKNMKKIEEKQNAGHSADSIFANPAMDGKARIQMTPEEAAAHDATNAAAAPAPMSVDAPKGFAPLPMAPVPSEAVPEGKTPEIIMPAAVETKPLDGVTRDQAALDKIEDEAFEDVVEAEPTLYDMPLEAFEDLEIMPDHAQEDLVKRAISEWYARYFDAKDLSDGQVQTIAEQYTMDRERADVLLEINRDIEIKQFNPNAMSEFDHKMIESHLAVDPASIKRALEDKAPNPGISGTDGRKAKSWLLPAFQAAAVGGVMAFGARMMLDGVTGGVGGLAAGGVGGAVGAYASEQFKLNDRAKKLIAENPELANLSLKKRKQHVIKQDKVTTLQERLAKVEKEIDKANQTVQNFQEDFDKKGGGLKGDEATLNKRAKKAKKAQKSIPSLERNRNELIKDLEVMKQRDPASFSLGKHLASRVIMGAVVGTVAGGVLSLEPVQATLSTAFNAVGGLIASTFDAALNLGSGANISTAGLGIGLDAVIPAVEPAPVDLKPPLGDGGYDSPLTILDGAAVVAGPADVVQASIAETTTLTAPDPIEITELAPTGTDGFQVVRLDEAVLPVAEALEAANFDVIQYSEIGAALDTHFEGNVPAEFSEHLAKLGSDNPAVAAEGAHSIAFLLIENNAELAKEGHRELASAIMAANVMEHGAETGINAVEKSIAGIAQYQPDLHQALNIAGGADLTNMANLVQQQATGDVYIAQAISVEALERAVEKFQGLDTQKLKI